MSASIDNLINVNFTKGRNDLLKFGLMLGGKGDYRPPQFDAESLKFEYIDANESYGIDLNGSRFLQKLTFAESQDFTRATTGTFIGSNGLIQTAAIDAPRFTHDPVTREVQGLLIEEQRTNLLTYSEQFDNTAWSEVNSTVTPSSELSPKGGTGAYVLTGDGTAQRSALIVVIPTYNTGDYYSVSIHLKAGTGRYGYLWFGTWNFGNARIILDLLTGLVTSVTGTPSYNIITLNNGWFRVEVSESASTGSSGKSLFIGVTESPTDIETVTTKSINIWGAQLEEGSFPTSYIPTAGTQVTRAVDDCVRVLGDEFNPEEGTLYAEAQYLNSNTTTGGTYGLTDGTSSQRMLVVFEPSGAAGGSSDFITAIITDANSVAATIPSSVNAVASGFHKVAISYNSTSFTFAVDGVIVGTASHAGVPTVDRIDGQGGTIGNNGTLTKDLYLFPTALSDAELTTLTGGT